MRYLQNCPIRPITVGMTALRPIVTACAVVVLLSAVAFAYANLTGGVGAPKVPRRHHAFTLTGHVENLHPGIPTVLRVRARNNLLHRVELRSVRAEVGDAGPACPGTLLRMQPIRGRRGLPPRRLRTVAIEVTLSLSAPDVCQDATWPIRYGATAALRTQAH